MPAFSADYPQNDVVSLVCRHQGRQATDQATTWADQATTWADQAPDQAPGHTTRAGHTPPIRPPITTTQAIDHHTTTPPHHPAPRPQATGPAQATRAHRHHPGPGTATTQAPPITRAMM